MVNVTHFETCTFSVETARAECGKFTLVRKFCNRVGLIHKLGQLRRAEELFYSTRNGTNVDERLRSDFCVFLSGSHSLLNDSLKTRNTDTELILEQLAHRTNATVGQVVDVVASAETVTQSKVVVFD